MFGREKAALALVVDREAEIGRIQDRHALEVELHAARRADAAVHVECDVARVQLPGGIVDRASREQHVEQATFVAVAREPDLIGRAAAGRLGRSKPAPENSNVSAFVSTRASSPYTFTSGAAKVTRPRRSTLLLSTVARSAVIVPSQ